jgi:amino acid transporter
LAGNVSRNDSAPTDGPRGHGFGTAPVYFAAISTILGAILFLRFGYAVGHIGLIGALGIIVLGHLVTVPTALAIAEIATNRKVEGGGEYFIISRSFGTTIGTVIGLSLYLSQAISVAFYMLAFAEAFRPLAPWVEGTLLLEFDPRLISLPAALIVILMAITKGASLGVKALYAVVATLGLSLLLFFLGDPLPGFDPESMRLTDKIGDPDPFVLVFAICFPAFTGMTAGVGLSGDLKDPKRSIPMGTLAATFTGIAVYVAVVFKLALSAPPEALASTQLIMADIAVWGPIIPIGLAAATVSSAIGSVLVAPRTLQALGADGALPWKRFNHWIARGEGTVNEPRNTTLVTSAIVATIVSLGSVDMVARLISMFFMVTYGALCAISFLEHFAARPSYRPAFRSRWYVSLLGALMCLFMMFQMDPLFALVAILTMVSLYRWISRIGGERDDLAAMFEGVMTQLSRRIRIRLQLRRERRGLTEWRPSVLMVNSRTFDRQSPLELMRWVCDRYGFGTYLHFIQDQLSFESWKEGERTKRRLLKMARLQAGGVYMDTVVSPSLTSAFAQSLQIPGPSGLGHNTAMFEFSSHDGSEVVDEIVEKCLFAHSARMTLMVLRHGDFHFGAHRTLDVWLTWNDRGNANLMILLSYIILGHKDWSRGEIRVFAALPSDQVEQKREEFQRLVAEGRIPISEKNIRFLPVNDQESFLRIVAKLSADSDLTVFGFDADGLRERGSKVFTNHPSLRDVLFVNASHEIAID